MSSRKGWCIAVLLLEMIFLAIGMIGLLRPSEILGGTELTQSLMQEGIPLRPGVYEARLYYEAEEDYVCSFWVETEEGTPFRGLRANPVSLFADRQEAVCQFYLTVSCEHLKICWTAEDGAPVALHGIEIVSGNTGNRIVLFWIIFSLALVDVVGGVYLYHKEHRYSKMTQIVMAGLCLVIICASVPLAVDYIVEAKEMTGNLAAIERLSRSFRGTNLFLVLPAVLRRIGLSMNMSYHMYVLAVNAAAAVLSYHCFKCCLRRQSLGLLGCILYTLNPYRIYCVYQTAIMWQYTAIIFLPLFFCGIYMLLCRRCGRKGTALCMAAAGCMGVWMCNLDCREIRNILPAVGMGAGILGICVLAKWLAGHGKRHFTQAAMGTLAAACILAALFQADKILFTGNPLWVYSMSDMENADDRGLNDLPGRTYR